MGFSQWLAGEMDAEGLNLSEAGQRFGVSHTTIKRWLEGASPTLDNLKAVSKAVHIDLEDLIAVITRSPTVEDSRDDEARTRIRGLVNDVRWTEEREDSIRRILRGYIERDDAQRRLQ